MSELTIEVVYALADRQELVRVQMPPGSTVGDAIDESELADAFPEDGLGALTVGVWGRVVPRDHLLADGDRVEIYRPLTIDPREARRRRAEGAGGVKGPRRN